MLLKLVHPARAVVICTTGFGSVLWYFGSVLVQLCEIFARHVDIREPGFSLDHRFDVALHVNVAEAGSRWIFVFVDRFILGSVRLQTVLVRNSEILTIPNRVRLGSVKSAAGAGSVQ